MRDKRVVGWTLFNKENFSDRLLIESVRAKAIYCFRWKNYQSAASQNATGLPNKTAVDMSRVNFKYLYPIRSFKIVLF